MKYLISLSFLILITTYSNSQDLDQIMRAYQLPDLDRRVLDIQFSNNGGLRNSDLADDKNTYKQFLLDGSEVLLQNSATWILMAFVPVSITDNNSPFHPFSIRASLN